MEFQGLNDINLFIEKNDKQLYLYGAGNVARAFCNYYEREDNNFDCKSLINGMIVTKKGEKDGEFYHNIPIMLISDLKKHLIDENFVIIIAVKESLRDSIIAELNSIGVNQYITISNHVVHELFYEKRRDTSTLNNN